jgi:hypothetical protein
MQTTTPKLKNITPQTGRMVNEENEVHNVVDGYGSLKTIGIENSAVHDGISWTYTGSASLAPAAAVYFLGRTGDLTAHLSGFAVDSDSAPILIEFFESQTVTSPGTQQTAINRNRQIVATATLGVYAGATVSADGTLLKTSKILGTQKTVSGQSLPGEWLLKKNTDYVFKITNQSNQTAAIAAGFNWLEAD